MFGHEATVVVALGGNALVRSGEAPSLATQFHNVGLAMRALVPLVENGNRVVVTHGNGFQVGNILIRVEQALGKAYALPLEVCVAESQGELGYMIEQSLQNALAERDIHRPVVSVLTQVVVDPDDPAFDHPTKPVGPGYDDAAAEQLRKRGHMLTFEKGRGWRRLVPSPRPIEIDDVAILHTLLEHGAIVVAAGGGGVPVIRVDGKLHGVAAVIDKDLASATLATSIGAQHMLILTGEPCVYRDYREPEQQRLPELDVAQAREYAAAGQFPPGSMGPKIEAAIEFLEAGGTSVVITSAEQLARALAGEAGTRITLHREEVAR